MEKGEKEKGRGIEEVRGKEEERKGEREGRMKRVSNGTATIGAQVVHAVRHEMALHLDDVVFRRTGLGTLGHPGVPAIKQAAELMRAELGWDETELANEMSGTVRQFETIPGK